MLSQMSHKQFDEWCAKDLVEPIGSNGTNEILMRLAMVVATGLGHKDVTVGDFATWIATKETFTDDSVAIAALEAIGARET
jgi:hypothetical protein